MLKNLTLKYASTLEYALLALLLTQAWTLGTHRGVGLDLATQLGELDLKDPSHGQI